MKEIKDKARELMKGFCRVCKVCDGKACAGEVPGMGGLNTASSFKNNVTALADIRVNMRLLHDAVEPDTSCSVLGYDLDMPVLAAPIGGISFNMGGGVSEEEYIDAVISGSKASGVIGCVGDGVPAFVHEAGNAAIVKNSGYGIPFIKPWEGDEMAEKFEKARATGCTTFGMDVDAAGLITLRQMGRPVSPKTADELKEIVEIVHGWGAKFILKGIMTADDAHLAAQVGVDAIVVSNHGGRVLDHTPGTAEVLPAVAEAVKGQIDVLVDGGVRDGADVLKMLALGADAVMIGRPISVAAVGGLQEGVEKYFATIKSQLLQAMVLTGSANIAAITDRVLYEG
ncbi:MAG: alpha-hydroxy-acid oxidizing protein [Pseudodesulfovibrio sp.]